MPVQNGPGDYLAFLGRISPEKRVDRAIEIARRDGNEAAHRGQGRHAPTRTTSAPRSSRSCATRSSSSSARSARREKAEFLGNAHALLFPIDWPEPFGLVMIEAMRCGTPVVAWDCGSVPEVIDDGVTGFVVDNMDDAVRAVGRAGELDRRRCRAVFETRFSADRMAHDYLAVYKRLIGQGQRRGRLESGDSRRPLSIG